MKPPIAVLLFLAFAIFAPSCQQQPGALTESQKAAIADSAKAVVQAIFSYSDKLDFNASFQLYSGDPDARFIENGVLFPSLDAMKKAYAELGTILESVNNSIDRWDTMVLAADAVAFTSPIHFSIKAKGRPEYHGEYVWSGIVQRRSGSWKLVQSHKSWFNAEQVIAAITPLPTKQQRAKK